MLVHMHFILLWPFLRKLIQLVSWGNGLRGLEIWVSCGWIHCIKGGVLYFSIFVFHFDRARGTEANSYAQNNRKVSRNVELKHKLGGCYNQEVQIF